AGPQGGAARRAHCEPRSGGAGGDPLMLSGRLTFRERFDWPLFLAVVVVAIVGVVNLYSATSPYVGVDGRSALADVYVSQVYWLVVGGLLGILVAAVDYRNFERLAYVFYAGGIVALLLVWVL